MFNTIGRTKLSSAAAATAIIADYAVDLSLRLSNPNRSCHIMRWPGYYDSAGVRLEYQTAYQRSFIIII